MCAAVLAGAVTAYIWTRVLGTARLTALATRLGAGRALERASGRLRSAGPVAIAVCRLRPGPRVYSTVVAGAVGIDLRILLAGIIPSIVVWVTEFTLLGIFVGVPAEHLFTHVQRLMFEGVVVAAIGVVAGAVAYLGLRHIPPAQRRGDALLREPRPWRLARMHTTLRGVLPLTRRGHPELVRAGHGHAAHGGIRGERLRLASHGRPTQGQCHVPRRFRQ